MKKIDAMNLLIPIVLSILAGTAMIGFYIFDFMNEKGW